jgi:hypothetical protein
VQVYSIVVHGTVCRCSNVCRHAIVIDAWSCGVTGCRNRAIAAYLLAGFSLRLSQIAKCVFEVCHWGFFVACVQHTLRTLVGR